MDILFALLFLVNAVSTVTVSVIAPFFPSLAEEKGLRVVTIGEILASNPIGAFITSLVLAKTLNQDNRVKILVIDLFIQAIGLLVFGFVNHINHDQIFIAVTICGRLIQGIGISAQAVPAYSFIPLFYENDIEKKMSLLELSTGLGYIAGPLIGALLYQLGGFSAPFLFFTVVQMLCIPLIYTQLKIQIKKLDDNNNEVLIHPEFKIDNQTVTSDGMYGFHLQKQIPISFKKIFEKGSISLTFLVTILSTFSYMYFEPILSLFLIQEYNISEDYTGYFMSVATITYIVGSVVIGHIMFAKKQLILTGVLMSAATFFFQGPDYLFTKIHRNIFVVLAAQGSLGLSCAMIFIPALPLMHEILLNMYPLQSENVGITASILFNIAVSCGEFIGPLAGGLITQNYGYTRGCSYTGIFLLIMGLTYTFVFCEKSGPKVFDSRKQSFHPFSDQKVIRRPTDHSSNSQNQIFIEEVNED